MIKRINYLYLFDDLCDSNEEIYEGVCALVTHAHTWGDTDHALVDAERFINRLSGLETEQWLSLADIEDISSVRKKYEELSKGFEGKLYISL